MVRFRRFYITSGDVGKDMIFRFLLVKYGILAEAFRSFTDPSYNRVSRLSILVLKSLDIRMKILYEI